MMCIDYIYFLNHLITITYHPSFKVTLTYPTSARKIQQQATVKLLNQNIFPLSVSKIMDPIQSGSSPLLIRELLHHMYFGLIFCLCLFHNQLIISQRKLMEAHKKNKEKLNKKIAVFQGIRVSNWLKYLRNLSVDPKRTVMFPCLFIFLSSVLQSVKVLLVLCLLLVAPSTNSSSRWKNKDRNQYCWQIEQTNFPLAIKKILGSKMNTL